MDEYYLDSMSDLDQIQVVFNLFDRNDEFAQMQAELWATVYSGDWSKGTPAQSDQGIRQVSERDFTEVMREVKPAARLPRSRKIDTSKWKF